MNIELKKIINELNNKSWIKALLKESNIFIVGGSVRDSFLNKQIKDIDLIVEGISFERIKEILFSFGRVDIVGESFSVIKFKETGTNEYIDIATPRQDRKIGNGHKGFEIITEGIDIITDLKRRDFTINSIAINIKTNEILDPFNGLQDLKLKLLRATDFSAFIEDALRILRGIQFSSRFEFDIEDSTLNLMKENAHLIKEISGERILDEFLKIVNKNGNINIAFNLLKDTNIDEALFNKKINIDFNINYTDKVSFFYLLAKLGDVNPEEFFKNRLKGDYDTAKNIKALDNLLKIKEDNEEEKRLKIFKIISKYPTIINSNIIPEDIRIILKKMINNEIPTFMSDLKINGDDIIILSNNKIKNEKIGILLDIIIKNALMNNFNWKSKKESINILKNLIKLFDEN
jgi:tRNA nucleotidyltransferase (CCA-adding enzyme)